MTDASSAQKENHQSPTPSQIEQIATSMNATGHNSLASSLLESLKMNEQIQVGNNPAPRQPAPPIPQSFKDNSGQNWRAFTKPKDE